MTNSHCLEPREPENKFPINIITAVIAYSISICLITDSTSVLIVKFMVIQEFHYPAILASSIAPLSVVQGHVFED